MSCYIVYMVLNTLIVFFYLSIFQSFQGKIASKFFGNCASYSLISIHIENEILYFRTETQAFC